MSQVSSTSQRRGFDLTDVPPVDSITFADGELMLLEGDSFRPINYRDVYFAGRSAYIFVDDETVVVEDLRDDIMGSVHDLWYLEGDVWNLADWA